MLLYDTGFPVTILLKDKVYFIRTFCLELRLSKSIEMTAAYTNTIEPNSKVHGFLDETVQPLCIYIDR